MLNQSRNEGLGYYIKSETRDLIMGLVARDGYQSGNEGFDYGFGALSVVVQLSAVAE